MQVLHWKHKWAFNGYSQKIESCLCYWHLGRIGNQSFDAKAGSILNMFDFSSNSGHIIRRRVLILQQPINKFILKLIIPHSSVRIIYKM
jgi:hypothetical protein